MNYGADLGGSSINRIIGKENHVFQNFNALTKKTTGTLQSNFGTGYDVGLNKDKHFLVLYCAFHRKLYCLE